MLPKHLSPHEMEVNIVTYLLQFLLLGNRTLFFKTFQATK